MKIEKIFTAVAVALTVSLSGCLDIYQHFSPATGKKVRVYTRFTVSKGIFEIANSMSEDKVDPDYDSIFSEFNSETLSKMGRVNPQIQKIDDDQDFGYGISVDLSGSDQDYEKAIASGEIPFLPLLRDKRIEIHYTPSDESLGKEKEEMTVALLSMVKYKITISKGVMPAIKRVSLQTEGGTSEYPALDIGDQYLIEIPLMAVLTQKSKIVIE